MARFLFFFFVGSTDEFDRSARLTINGAVPPSPAYILDFCRYFNPEQARMAPNRGERPVPVLSPPSSTIQSNPRSLNSDVIGKRNCAARFKFKGEYVSVSFKVSKSAYPSYAYI